MLEEKCPAIELVTSKIEQQPRFMTLMLDQFYERAYDSIEELDKQLTRTAEKMLRRIAENFPERYTISRPFYGHVKVTCQWCFAWCVFDLLHNLDMSHFVCGSGKVR